MQYKNLNSLGRAYRAGNVDRSTYIRQRRQIIDDFTGPSEDDGENATVINTATALSEESTVISTATALAAEKPPVAPSSFSGKYLYTVGLFLVVLGGIIFFFVRR